MIDPESGEIRWSVPSDLAGSTQTFTVRATDNGNPSLSGDETFAVAVESAVASIRLVEGDDFRVMHEEQFAVPDTPSALSFTYANLNFDTTDTFINDAFEAAFVDTDGNPLVHAYSVGRDSFFNVAEESDPSLGATTSITATTVTVDLSRRSVRLSWLIDLAFGQ